MFVCVQVNESGCTLVCVYYMYVCVFLVSDISNMSNDKYHNCVLFVRGFHFAVRKGTDKWFEGHHFISKCYVRTIALLICARVHRGTLSKENALCVFECTL